MKTTWEVDIKISFPASVEVEAKNEAEAIKLAKDQINDFYHLNSMGAPHLPLNVSYDVDAYKVEDI